MAEETPQTTPVPQGKKPMSTGKKALIAGGACTGCCLIPFVVGLVIGIATITYLCNIYVEIKSKIDWLDRLGIIESTLDLAANEKVQNAYNSLPLAIRATTPLTLFMQIAHYKSILDTTCWINSSGSSGYGTGTVICPDGTLSVVAQSPDLISKLNANIDLYKQAAAETNVPWEVLAALHYREANFNSGHSALSGEPIGSYNSDNGMTTSSFYDSLVKAGNHFRSKIEVGINEGTLPANTVLSQDTVDQEVLGKGFLWYNAGNHGPFGDNYLTKEHSYVMNNFSQEYYHLPFNNGGVHNSSEARDGAYTVFSLLKTATFNSDGSVATLGDCIVGTTSGSGYSESDTVPFATQLPLDLNSTTNQNYGTPTHVVVHYTADNLSANNLRNYFQGTLNDSNSSNNTYVQFWIGKNGEIVQLTPTTKQVAGAAGFNSTGNGGISVSIENQGLNQNDLLGNFNSTTAQVDANVKLIKYLMDTYNIPKNNIIGHSAVTPGKIDPGSQFMQLILDRL